MTVFLRVAEDRKRAAGMWRTHQAAGDANICGLKVHQTSVQKLPPASALVVF